MIQLKNKVLIKLIIPKLDTNYDLFIPVNESIYKIKKLIIKSIRTKENINNNSNYLIINKKNSRIYQNNETVINTDIRNASELILVSSN